MTVRAVRRTWLVAGSLALVAAAVLWALRTGDEAASVTGAARATAAGAGAGGRADAGAAGGAAALAEGSGEDDEVLPVDMPDLPAPPGARPDASGAELNRGIFSDYGFPGFPDLEHLCEGRVPEPGGGQLIWDVFTTQESPATVVAHYQRWLSWRGFTADKPGGTWSLPAGAPVPTRTLRVTEPSASGRHQNCTRKPPPDTKTIIVLSRH